MIVFYLEGTLIEVLGKIKKMFAEFTRDGMSYYNAKQYIKVGRLQRANCQPLHKVMREVDCTWE